MFSLCRRKVRSQAPCSFPVRSGSRNKATASVCGRKLFTQDSFRFSGSHSIDYKWPKNCAKKNNMDAFYSLKKQSCFHNSSKLLLYVSERTSTRKCWPADYTTAIKPAEQKPNVHHVLTFGTIPDLLATLCSQIRHLQALGSPSASGIPETFPPRNNFVISQHNSTLFVHESWQAKLCAIWHHCKNHLIFQRERCWRSGFYTNHVQHKFYNL